VPAVPAGGTFALYAMISRACGIPAVNAGTMPADKQLFESVAHSVAGSSNSIIQQLKVPGQHGGHDCPEAAAAHKLAGCDGQGCSHGHGARLAKVGGTLLTTWHAPVLVVGPTVLAAHSTTSG
jgi:hypothetical protein